MLLSISHSYTLRNKERKTKLVNLSVSNLMNQGYRKVIGEHSLTVGEIVGLVIAFVVWHFKLLGNWSTYAAIGVGVLFMALF
jgi:hypothetical protein